MIRAVEKQSSLPDAGESFLHQTLEMSPFLQWRH